MCILLVGNLENTKHIRVQEQNRSPSNRQRSPMGTRSISRSSQAHQTETLNGNQHHARNIKQEPPLKTSSYKSSQKDERSLNTGNEIHHHKASGINIQVQHVGESTKSLSTKNRTKLQPNKKDLELHLNPNNEGSLENEKRQHKVGTEKKTISQTSTSKIKNHSTLEVDWVHLKTPPSTRKTVSKSPSQTSRVYNKNISQSSQHQSMEKNSSTTRKVAQKARTTNLALSMKIAHSTNISHAVAKQETKEDKRLKVTKQRG